MPDGMEMTTILYISAVECIFRHPQHLEMVPSLDVLQREEKLGIRSFGEADHTTEFIFQADDSPGKEDYFLGTEPRMHVLGRSSRKRFRL